MTLHIQVRPLRGSTLVEDYLRGEGKAAPYFEGRPFDVESYREKLAEVRGRFDRAARERVAAAVRPTSARAAERLRDFVEKGGAVVTTGQQAGLFGGPLYTVHKILTALRLAEALERELGEIVLPVFWIASEDHDFNEVRHVEAVDERGSLRSFSVAATDPHAVPMSDMKLGEDIESAVDEFSHLLCEYGSSDEWIRQIRDTYRSGVTVADAFRALTESLFSGFDVLVTDAADPAVKEASLHVLLGEAEHAAEHERLVRERSDALAADGYVTQVVVVPETANLFFHGPRGRERLVRKDGAWLAPEARVRFSDQELAEAIRSDPRSFSPNVFLRPVVESAVFPTLAYVGGPAETAYFAQIGPLFRAFGIRAPVVFPRFSATIAPSEAEETLGDLGLEMADLAPPLHEVLHRVARDRVPAAVADGLAALRASIVDRYAVLMDAAGEIDPTLSHALGSARNRALLGAADAEQKILRQLKRRDAGLLRAVAVARNHLRPNGVPQERVLNVFPYLAEYGPSLLHDLAEQMTVTFSETTARAESSAA